MTVNIKPIIAIFVLLQLKIVTRKQSEIVFVKVLLYTYIVIYLQVCSCHVFV